MGRVDGQRGQNREELPAELVRKVPALAGPQLVPAQDLQPMLAEGRQQILIEQPRLAGGSSRMLLAGCCLSPPTRFMKNSSRLLSKMARNFSRSRSGLDASSASWSTRRLNSSHESSRFRKSDAGSRGSAGDSAGDLAGVMVLGSDTDDSKEPQVSHTRPRRFHLPETPLVRPFRGGPRNDA